jgi:hypothetical protein
MEAAALTSDEEMKGYISDAIAECKLVGEDEDIAEMYIGVFADDDPRHQQIQDVEIDEADPDDEDSDGQEPERVKVIEQVGGRWYIEHVKAFEWRNGWLLMTDEEFELHFT